MEWAFSDVTAFVFFDCLFLCAKTKAGKSLRRKIDWVYRTVFPGLHCPVGLQCFTHCNCRVECDGLKQSCSVVLRNKASSILLSTASGNETSILGH